MDNGENRPPLLHRNLVLRTPVGMWIKSSECDFSFTSCMEVNSGVSR